MFSQWLGKPWFPRFPSSEKPARKRLRTTQEGTYRRRMNSTLTDEQKIALFHKMAAAWEKKDWRTCADLLAPDGVLHSMMEQPLIGRETFYRLVVGNASANKQVKLHIDRIGVINGAVVVERRDEIIIDGESRSVNVVGILEFKDGLVSLWREYYDRAQLQWARRKAPATA